MLELPEVGSDGNLKIWNSGDMSERQDFRFSLPCLPPATTVRLPWSVASLWSNLKWRGPGNWKTENLSWSTADRQVFRFSGFQGFTPYAETEKLKFWNMADWQFFRISGFYPLLSLKFCKPENLNFWSLMGRLDFTCRQSGAVASSWSQSGWQASRTSDFHRMICNSVVSMGYYGRHFGGAYLNRM